MSDERDVVERARWWLEHIGSLRAGTGELIEELADEIDLLRLQLAGAHLATRAAELSKAERVSDVLCECGHAAGLHARVDQRDKSYRYPCRQVLPLDPLDGRLSAEPLPCPCVDFRAPAPAGIYNGSMS